MSQFWEKCVTDRLTDWRTDGQTDRSNFIAPFHFSSEGPKTDWLTDWLTYLLLTDWMTDWPTDWTEHSHFIPSMVFYHHSTNHQKWLSSYMEIFKSEKSSWSGDVMIDQWLINTIDVFPSWYIIIIPKIIQNDKAVPEIFKFENYPITYQVT